MNAGLPPMSGRRAIFGRWSLRIHVTFRTMCGSIFDGDITWCIMRFDHLFDWLCHERCR
jgi:hypothetical protein